MALTDQQLEDLAGRHRLDLSTNFNSAPQRLLERSQSQAIEYDDGVEIPDASLPMLMDEPSEAPRASRRRLASQQM